MTQVTTPPNDSAPPLHVPAWWRRLRRPALVALALPLAYLAAVAIGLLPANRGFRHQPRGIDIYVFSNGVHTDLILPSRNEVHDWTAMLPVRDFRKVEMPMSHLQFGWGDRVFYLETPTWSDVQVSNVLRAMFWSSDSVMHVAYLGRPLESDDCRKISIAPAQYKRLVAQLEECFQLDERGRPHLIPDVGYGPRDAFYSAHGNYHLFYTCNCWTGDLLRDTGVRCGIWTPSTHSVMWTLPGRPE